MASAAVRPAKPATSVGRLEATVVTTPPIAPMAAWKSCTALTTNSMVAGAERKLAKLPSILAMPALIPSVSFTTLTRCEKAFSTCVVAWPTVTGVFANSASIWPEAAIKAVRSSELEALPDFTH